MPLQTMSLAKIDVIGTRKSFYLWTMVATLVVFFGCAHYEIKPVPSFPRAGMLKNSQSGVDIYISSFEDEGVAADAFDADLRGNNVFGLFVRIANHSNEEVRVSRKRMLLSCDQRFFPQMTFDNVANRLRFSPIKRYFAWSLGLLGIGIIPGTVDGYKAVSENRSMQEDLSDKVLRNRILLPGGVVAGFLFFDVDKTVQPTDFTVEIGTSSGQKVLFSMERK